MINRLTRSGSFGRGRLLCPGPAERAFEVEVGDVSIVCCGSGDAGVGCGRPGSSPEGKAGLAPPGRMAAPPHADFDSGCPDCGRVGRRGRRLSHSRPNRVRRPRPGAALKTTTLRVPEGTALRVPEGTALRVPEGTA